MNRISAVVSSLLALCAVAATGCASKKQQAAMQAVDASPMISPGLISPYAEGQDAPWTDEPTAEEMLWLASRNDSHITPDTRIPEVADPGSYFIQTRDFQRTFNGRPWNQWTSRTWVEQRGGGR